MINMYKINKDKNLLESTLAYEENTWINLISPTLDEVEIVANNTGIDSALIKKMLDNNELARIEQDDSSTLVIIDYPLFIGHNQKNHYVTLPLGMILSNDNKFFVTIMTKENDLLNDFFTNNIKFDLTKKVRLIIQIILNVTNKYLKLLKVINEEIESKEKRLISSTKNKDLIGLLNIQKSLVYFITSLKENDGILERLKKQTTFKLCEDEIDLLENAIIENKQGIETANIYREIVASSSEIYATIISNNLNVVMKFLAGITIVVSIPTMVASFLGMNVPLGSLAKSDYSFIAIVAASILVAILLALLLKKKDML